MLIHPALQRGVPVGVVEIQGCGDVQVMALAHHQKPGEFIPDCGRGLQKILPQDNVGVDIGQDRGFGHSPGPIKEVLDQGSAVVAHGHVRDVAQVQLPGDLGGAGVAAEEDDVRAGRKPGPAGQGISLDDAGVPLEGLGNGEDGEGRGLRRGGVVCMGNVIPCQPAVQVLLEIQGARVMKGPGQFLFQAGKGLLKAAQAGQAHGLGVVGAGKMGGGLGRSHEMFQGLLDFPPGEELHALAEAGQGRGGAPVQAEAIVPRQGEFFHGIEKV